MTVTIIALRQPGQPEETRILQSYETRDKIRLAGG